MNLRLFRRLIRLASGATWQSSGRGLLMCKIPLIETHFTKYSRQLYDERLHKEGHDIGSSIAGMNNVDVPMIRIFCLCIGFNETGSLWVAQTSDRLTYAKTAIFNHQNH